MTYDGTGSPLAGAEFALYTDAQCTVPALDLDTDGHPAWTAASNADGIVSFENVRVGTYYMKETSAPSPYVLDETIYKVVIEDSRDTSRHSKITINGDATETEVTEIANAQSGKITVLKKWLDAFGTETDGGNKQATVWLKRKHMVPGGYLITETYPVQFTVSGGIILNTQGTMTGVEYSPATATTDAEFIIPNTSGATLPDAGGPGTNLFYMIGCILTMLAGAGIVMKRRRRGSE